MIEEIKESIWKVVTDKVGPTVTVIGGTHGNELTGIEVVKKLKAQFGAGEIKLSSGTVFLMLGNLKAMEINQRWSGDHRDLNRQFYNERIESEPDGTYEDSRMREMLPILKESDISLDIHSANKPCEPFLCSASSAKHDLVTRWFKAKKIVTDPNYVLGGQAVATDEYVDLQGGVGVCYETGLATDTSRIDEVIVDILNVLRDQGMINDGVVLPDITQNETYELVEAIVLTEDGFEYKIEGGSFTPFVAGEIVGIHGDGKEIKPDFDGVIIFPKPKDHWVSGLPIGYLAKII